MGYRGRTAARITVKTHGGHASSSWAHPSAVDESLAIMSLIKEYEKRNTVEGNHYRSLSASLTVIKGRRLLERHPEEVPDDLRRPHPAGDEVIEGEGSSSSPWSRDTPG